MSRTDDIKKLLADPTKLLMKKPFTRGSASYDVNDSNNGEEANMNALRPAVLPDVEKTIITQDKFLKELDPQAHEVMFDKNLPSICVKLGAKNTPFFSEINFKRMPLNIQERIREKQTLTLCGHPRVFTLVGTNPDEIDKKNFATIREYWQERNQDGMQTKAVYIQKGMGDVGLLYYYDYKGRVKSRILSYEDGYVIISHNDENGDRLLETVYYKDAHGVEYIDSYDDMFFYRKTRGLYPDKQGEWVDEKPEKHNFSEIPLVTKRGNVGWNDVEGIIEAYEILYNIYLVIEKRHGWGILYIRGKVKDNAQKLAGSIILNDTSLDGKGSAEFKTPPSPTGIIETLNSMFEQIQIGSSTTFILPKDVKSAGDISAIAIMLTQELDIEGATQGVIDWQNFADKCCRLFKEGLAKELVNSDINKNAVTEFAKLRISCKFKIWRPFNEAEYNQMLCTLKNAGLISKKTGIEKNTVSTPDEEMRIDKQQKEEDMRLAKQKKDGATSSTSQTSSTNQ